MSDIRVSITNRRENTPMDLADGNGGLIHIPPNETRIVRGDFNYFRRAAKEIGGLVVRVAPGGANGKVDHDYAPANISSDVHKVRIYNYREIPLRLATGVDRQHIDIPRKKKEKGEDGKETDVPGVVETVARVSLIKQMSGIKVEILDKKKDGEPLPERASVKQIRKSDAPTLRVESDSDTPKTSEPPSDSLESLREKLGLPETAEEFINRVRSVTWHDLRGMCRQLGFNRPQSAKHAAQLIGSKMYPGYDFGIKEDENPDATSGSESKSEPDENPDENPDTTSGSESKSEPDEKKSKKRRGRRR